ncbi:unnamed protein product [Rotaria magnacalcarata]|uniref:Uncharacterized protein n=1 Tax=Rotaria magnacalcarata TaxID=392030 RepID=A0A816PY41_9BILA|nr:unnamed protein product [Rotaria magnacalcarata]CAF2135487.1 unnamed protein product [Rotaria magnacalcarata]CAF3999239.1 unnamed protein product [Rotaria magnacalcarata]CAF4456233.1 unnamed protein product [Rotaria magnacalcarata]
MHLLQETPTNEHGVLSPTQQLAGQSLNAAKKKSKCHGNIKLQRFKRKWRKRGLTEEQINELIQQRNAPQSMKSIENTMISKENNPNKNPMNVEKNEPQKKRIAMR